MTMRLRIENTDEVRACDVHTVLKMAEAPEDAVPRRDVYRLGPGQSHDVYLHRHQHIEVYEVQS